jgi:hypothetical protein
MLDPNKKKKTHASNGDELSLLFIAEDNLLSIFANDDECEVKGIGQNIFGMYGLELETK